MWSSESYSAWLYLSDSTTRHDTVCHDTALHGTVCHGTTRHVTETDTIFVTDGKVDRVPLWLICLDWLALVCFARKVICIAHFIETMKVNIAPSFFSCQTECMRRPCLSAHSYLAVWFAPKQVRLSRLSREWVESSRVYEKTLLVGSQLFSCVVCAKTGSSCYYTTNVHTPLVGPQL